MIRLEGVSKTFRGPDGAAVVALRGLDLAVEAGETLAILGASGCGKTTTLRMINRLDEPTAGRVVVEGVDVAAVDPVRLRRRIGYVVQSGALLPHLTVAGNVGLLLRLERWDARRRRRRVDELLELVRLPPSAFRDRYPSELSGGERQRAGVARALALDPPVLLMDEPFGALDPITRAEVRAEFLELRELVEKTTVVVTHDVDEAFALGDRVALLDRGSVAQVGTRADFRERPASELVRRFVAERLAR